MRLPFLRRTQPPAPRPAPGPHHPAVVSQAAALPVIVYGGSWCIDCHIVTRYLDRHQVPYRWIDLARDHDAQERLTAMGYRAIPVVVLPDGRTFVEPSTRELAGALGHA